MTLIKPAALLCLVCITLITAVHADVTIESKHKLVQAQPAGAGSLVTLDITIHNSGSSYLNGVTVSAQGPFFPADPAANAIHIDALPAGGSYTTTWNIPSGLPSGQLYPGLDMPVNLDVRATDDAGAAVTLNVVSTAEVN